MDSLEEKKNRFNRLKPLTPTRALRALEDAYDIELTYTSNAIEGNTLTLRETADVVGKGAAVEGKSLRDHFEAVDHFDALRFVRRLAQGQETLDESAILKIHRIVLSHSQPDQAGQYGKGQRGIQGSPVRFPSPDKVPGLMTDFSSWLQTQDNTPSAAFEAHYRLVTIHPFTDGNGRTARLLMNLILLRGGYPPVVIEPEQRLDYMSSLNAATVRQVKQPYVDFMTDRLHASLDHHIRTLEAAGPKTRRRPQPKT